MASREAASAELFEASRPLLAQEEPCSPQVAASPAHTAATSSSSSSSSSSGEAANASSAAAPLPPPPQQQQHQTRYDVIGSLASFPIAVGQPVAFADEAIANGLMFLPGLPNVLELWREQAGLMLLWGLSSALSLILFSPFFLSSSGLFLGAEVAAILSIVAAGVHLTRRNAADGLELALQIKVAASCGAAACFLDSLTAFLTLIIIWSISCEAEDDGGTCNSLMNWAAVFGVYLTWHAYISMTVAARARALLPLLNPVSSGVVQL